MQVEPINFKLKSLSEQQSILNSYKSFLKSCDFDFQIYVQTQKADIDNHIREVEKCVMYEEDISDMARDYIDFIKELSKNRGSISRKFFIILKINQENSQNKINKIKSGLMDCGNLVRICEREELNKIIKNCYKRL